MLHHYYLVEVLRGQPIKFIQVVFISEFHEDMNITLRGFFFQILPLGVCIASEAETT